MVINFTSLVSRSGSGTMGKEALQITCSCLECLVTHSCLELYLVTMEVQIIQLVGSHSKDEVGRLHKHAKNGLNRCNKKLM